VANRSPPSTLRAPKRPKPAEAGIKEIQTLSNKPSSNKGQPQEVEGTEVDTK